MAYQMARLPMTLSYTEGHFCCLYLCNALTQEIWRVVTTVCFHINWKAHVSCDLNFIVKGEGLLKVTGSHVHWKSSNISETVLEICC